MLTEQQETRGVGRPSQGKRNVTLSLAPETVAALNAMPAGERSAYIDQLVARDQEQKGKQ
jgi:hypothetical protein